MVVVMVATQITGVRVVVVTVATIVVLPYPGTVHGTAVLFIESTGAKVLVLARSQSTLARVLLCF